jgi:hypothetical protein
MGVTRLGAWSSRSLRWASTGGGDQGGTLPLFKGLIRGPGTLLKGVLRSVKTIDGINHLFVRISLVVEGIVECVGIRD